MSKEKAGSIIKKLGIPAGTASALCILACCLIAFWPLTFGLFSLKNDATLYFLPVRYQVSEMIRHGYFPFWTPYLHLGYPLYSDMQAGVWNPFVYLISLFGSYTMRSLQVELLIYVYLCGISMFCLLQYLKIEWRISLLLAISYMLCGFNLDSSQFAYWISGMSFLPFIFLYYHKVLHQFKWKDALRLSLSSYLLFVCAYPGELILVVYFLLIYLLVFLVKEKPGKQVVLKIFKVLFTSALLAILLSLPAIVSYISSLNYVVRGGKISYDLAITNAMHPVNLLSYILPLSVWKIQPQITDLLGRNSYFGLLPLLLLFISFYYKRNYFTGFLKWAFILSLLFCLGDYGIIRKIFYQYLPLMDTFRHPSMARFICIFSGCILAAICFNQLSNDTKTDNKKLISFILILLLIASSPFFLQLAGFNPSFNLDDFAAFEGFKKWLDNSTLSDWLIIEITLQLPLLILIYFFFVRKLRINALVTGSVISMIIHAAILQPVTVVKSESANVFQNKIDSYTQTGFPFPKIDSSVNSNSQSDPEFQKAYGPVNMFNKKIGEAFIFVSPSPLKSYEKMFSADNTEFRNRLFDYPILYKAEKIVLSTDTAKLLEKRIVLIDDSALYRAYSDFATSGSYIARLTDFSPNSWKFEITSETDGFYCLMQHYYPKWKLYVNNKEEKLIPCNISLMGFAIKKGKNIVELRFSDNLATRSIYISLITLVFVIYFLRKRK